MVHLFMAGPYDVVLSAVLDVAQEAQITSEKAVTLQAAWRRRNVQGKFQTAVQEMMEINVRCLSPLTITEQLPLPHQAL